MTSSQSYIITSLDFASQDIEDYRYSGAKIFYFRMVEDENAELLTLLNDWSILAEKTGKVNIPPPTLVKVSTVERVFAYPHTLETLWSNLSQILSLKNMFEQHFLHLNHHSNLTFLLCTL